MNSTIGIIGTETGSVTTPAASILTQNNGRGVKPVKNARKSNRAEYLPEDNEYDSDGCEDNEALRKEFVAALKIHANATTKLSAVVFRAMQADIDPSDMVEWGVDAGYSESYVRATISSILRAQGVQRRSKGAGRKGNKGADSLLAYARREFGDSAAKTLLAAYRLCVKQDKADAKK